jgi:hypothetical protein
MYLPSLGVGLELIFKYFGATYEEPSYVFNVIKACSDLESSPDLLLFLELLRMAND